MPVLIGLGVGALLLFGGRWLLSRTPSSPGGIASARGREQVRDQVRERTQEKARVEKAGLLAFGDSSLEYAAAGGTLGGAAAGAIFGAALGPVGAVIGLGLGFFVGAILDGLGQPTYGRIVRDSLAQWNREHSFPSSAVATDATLFRDGLLGAAHLYRHRRTGQLAVEVLGRDASGLRLSLFGGALQGDDAPFVPGPCSSQVKQQIVGWSPGMLDGPSQRNANSAFLERARNRELYAIEYVAPKAQWRTPGYVFFAALWPRLNREHPFAKSADWEQVTPTAENVDQLAQAFDRAAGGIIWQPAEAA